MTTRFQMNVAAYLLLVRDGKVLLLRRYGTGYEDGNYSLIAGHLEGGETVEQAICREALEEGGLVLETSDVSIAHVMHRRGEEGRERIDFFCIAKKWRGEPTNCEPHKCDDLSWFSLDELPANTIPYIREALRCVQEKIPFSSYGF